MAIQINLRRHRVSKNLNQNELSELSKVRQATISDIENGKIPSGIRILCKLAKTLNVSVSDLIECEKGE